MPSNKGIWISATNELSEITIKDDYCPGNDELLIQVSYSGINPADLFHGRALGLNGHVAGYDFSGKVLKKGINCEMEVGTNVMGAAAPGVNRPIFVGAHQDFLIIPESASCLPVVARAAIDGLFNILGLPDPEAIKDARKENPAPILIWGGSSSVGLISIWMAKAVGAHPIIATASPQHHAALYNLGATHCFDYRDSGVVQMIKDVLSDTSFEPLRAFDTIGKENTSDLVAACCEPGTKIASTQFHPRCLLVSSGREYTISGMMPNGVPFHVEGQPKAALLGQRLLRWVLTYYGKDDGFKFPNVRAVEGSTNAIAAVRMVADGNVSMEKIAVKHPL
ncbi:unnamed protein product [Clonostachys rosea]|uniref:Enoyl reductase (ER) domain-containing protein n=1 Tax=Bionectria ochroleuca TaxID=29856 RepID=A0ABY6UYB0_BIOOC|nr:unnamed protein product [Clonostachys rosea]